LSVVLLPPLLTRSSYYVASSVVLVGFHRIRAVSGVGRLSKILGRMDGSIMRNPLDGSIMQKMQYFFLFAKK